MSLRRYAFALTAAAALLTVPSGQAKARVGDDASCQPLAESLVRELVEQHLTRIPPQPIADEDDAADKSSLEVVTRASTDRPSSPPPMPDPAPEAEPTAGGRAESAPRRATRRPRAPIAEKAKADSRGPANYSKTNTQEAEVDEGDIVKTDGRFVYHLSSNYRGPHPGPRNELRIYASWPIRSARLLARYALPGDVAPQGVEQLYLFDGHVAIIGRATHGYGARTMDEVGGAAATRVLPARTQLTRVVVLDVADKTRPVLVRQIDVEGQIVDTRMIGQRLYLATSSDGVRLPMGLVQDVALTTYRIARHDVDAIVADLASRWDLRTVDLGLPRYREVSQQARSRPLYTCEDLVYDANERAPQLLNLAHIDLAQRAPIEGAGMNGYSGASRVYASEGAFYVANAHTPRVPNGQTESIVKKFEFGRAGKPRFVAKGYVRGHLLNQFSMSEYGGFLRVATSDNWRESQVHVLQTEGDKLEPVGQISGIAPGERIYAVRMMGAKGYVVTFRRTDPLYTLDLSNPRAPRVVGELKIEGWSSYLHPLDEDHLLTVGQDADARGRSTGFHLQIFDVSDPRNPRRTHHEKLDAGSMSSAQSDHHAFMFEPHTKTLAIPWKGSNYWGLVAYHVDAKRGFTSLGRVNHALMYKQFFRRHCRGSESSECGRRNYWWKFFTAQDLDVDRVVAIDGHLFSLSRSGLLVHSVGRRLRQRRAVLVNEPEWRPAEPNLTLGAAW